MADKSWANDSLRLGIRILKGEVVKCQNDEELLQVVLVIKENLQTFGFPWQAARLDNHIHRWQARRARSRARAPAAGGLQV